MSTIRVWEGELLYEDHPEIKPEFDEDTEELFKLIEETPEEESTRVKEEEEYLVTKGRSRVRHQIEKIREQLNGLEHQMEIFNSYGLQIITQNLDSVSSTMFMVALDQTKKD